MATRKFDENSPTQTALFMPDHNWTPPSDLPDLRRHGDLVVDVETCDPHLTTRGPGTYHGDSYTIGYVLTTDHWSQYLPIAHQGGGNMDPKLVKRYVSDMLGDEKQRKIGHNIMYDLEKLRHDGIEVKGPLFDTMVMCALLDEEQDGGYSLNRCAGRYTGELKSYDELYPVADAMGIPRKKIVGNMWRLHAGYAASYAIQDGDATLKLFRTILKIMEDDGLQDVLQLECNLLRPILDSRSRGVLIDVDKIDQLKQKYTARAEEIKSEIARRTSCRIDLWSGQSLATVFDECGVQYGYSEKGNPTFDDEYLAANDHWLPTLVREGRKLEKAVGTFLDGTLLANVTDKGRIHASVHQTASDDGGTVSGRFAYSNPNLQFIPSAGFIGYEIRDLFIPDPGALWACADYSAQEPRLTVHYAYLRQLVGAAEAVQLYLENPGTDFHQMVADMAGIPRKQAKTINLGMAYGMGQAKLAHDLGLSLDDGKALFKQYHEFVPFMRELAWDTARVAGDRGYIKTLGGRRARFNMWEPALKWTERQDLIDKIGWKAIAPQDYETALKLQRNPNHKGWYNRSIRRAFTHKALNRLIQGSAADMIKHSIVNLHNEGFTIYMTVHDENNAPVATEAEGKRFQEIMEDAVKISVPLLADTGVSTSWIRAKNIAEEIGDARKKAAA